MTATENCEAKWADDLKSFSNLGLEPDAYDRADSCTCGRHKKVPF